MNGMKSSTSSTSSIIWRLLHIQTEWYQEEMVILKHARTTYFDDGQYRYILNYRYNFSSFLVESLVRTSRLPHACTSAKLTGSATTSRGDVHVSREPSSPLSGRRMGIGITGISRYHLAAVQSDCSVMLKRLCGRVSMYIQVGAKYHHI